MRIASKGFANLTIEKEWCGRERNELVIGPGKISSSPEEELRQEAKLKEDEEGMRN